ncbi:hypothetical protein BABINDRAFT_162758 [Babjeviella inositovora NRRL Y-12698]|uniref:Rab-GAP TBC domain-containing protein n=1 Tax=Babjeviella inositovora NRRL Y-12698 TaxID=984486 RepID=A0A1E3QN84_9ASCO|nr:uncharacterized protein BABINDRAFT_162758 [Babjeviella inositovora NRRL Y-12698]ODQ78552.1 hypothetical protein BABINDRAFT_162758 [Babjeviella inositovora NRRL Y-12698]
MTDSPPPLPPRDTEATQQKGVLTPLPLAARELAPKRLSRPDLSLDKRFVSLDAGLSSPLSPALSHFAQNFSRRLSMHSSVTGKTLSSFSTGFQQELRDEFNWFLVKRQYDVLAALYSSSSETCASVKAGDAVLRVRFAKLCAVAEQQGADWSWWETLLGDYARKPVLLEMEQNLNQLQGFPCDARGVLYLSILRAKSALLEDAYAEMVASGRACDKNDELNILLENYSRELADSKDAKGLKTLLRCFTIYTGDIPSAHVVNVALVLHGASTTSALSPESLVDLSEAETFSVLLKFDAIYSDLNKDEFYYKMSRTLEDTLPAVYLHLTAQGVILSSFYKKILSFEFFKDMFTADVNKETAGSTTAQFVLQNMDMVVLQGVDYFTKFILHVFTAHQERILASNLNQQTQFLHVELLNTENYSVASSSSDFSDEEPTFFTATLYLTPDFIKYENEYNLLNNNSLNLNNTELINLKETNEDLTSKLQELNSKFEHLNKNHLAIVQENQEILQELAAQSADTTRLSARRDALAAQVQQLGMNEEILQTRERNEKFGAVNDELKQQIEETKRDLEAKRLAVEELRAAETVA